MVFQIALILVAGAILIYLLVSIVGFIFSQPTERGFGFDYQTVLAKYENTEELQALESRLRADPHNLNLMLELAGAYMFNKRCSLEAKELSFRMMNEHPLIEYGWMHLGVNFDAASSDPELDQPWQKAIKKYGYDYNLLLNAVEFFSAIGSPLLKNYARLLIEYHPLDPRALQQLAQFEEIGSARFELIDREIAMNWSRDDFRKLLRARSTIGAFFYPKLLSKLWLRIFGNRDHMFDSLLSYALQDAVKLKDFTRAERYYRLLTNHRIRHLISDSVKIREQEPIARYGVLTGDRELVQKSYTEMINAPLLENDEFQVHPPDLLHELLQNGYRSEANGLASKLLEAYPQGHFADEYKLIVKASLQ